MTQKEIFKNLDLRKQLTEDMKSKWYYQNIKHGLYINKKSVTFDGDFHFKVVFHPYEFEGQDESFMMLKYWIDDNKEDATTQMYIQDNDKYSDKTEDILKHILLYVANYI